MFQSAKVIWLALLRCNQNGGIKLDIYTTISYILIRMLFGLLLHICMSFKEVNVIKNI